jgi:hypothetical protein
MKITVNELRKIISEEVGRMLEEEIEEGILDPVKKMFGMRTTAKVWPDTPEKAKKFWPNEGDKILLPDTLAGYTGYAEVIVEKSRPDRELLLKLEHPTGRAVVAKLHLRKGGATKLTYKSDNFEWEIQPKVSSWNSGNMIAEVIEIFNILKTSDQKYLLDPNKQITSPTNFKSSLDELATQLGAGVGVGQLGSGVQGTDPPLQGMNLGEVIEKFAPKENESGECVSIRIAISQIYREGAVSNLANQMLSSQSVMSAIYGDAVGTDPGAVKHKLHKFLGTQDIVSIAFYKAWRGQRDVCEALESIVSGISMDLSSVRARKDQNFMDSSLARTIRGAFGR